MLLIAKLIQKAALICRSGLKYDICSAFSLKNKEDILSGDEQQVKTKLDLLGFVEIPKDKYNLSTIKLEQKEIINLKNEGG